MLHLVKDTVVEAATRYQKIYNPFKRSADGRKVLIGEWARDEFGMLADTKWTATEKMDGTNLRVSWRPKDGEIIINGRKANSELPGDLRDRLESTFLESGRWNAAFTDFTDHDICVTLYGEGIGPGIQKGGAGYLPIKDFCLFDVRVENLWLRQEDVTEVARKMALRRAPVMGLDTLKNWMSGVALGFNSKLPGANKDKKAEGVMCRPQGNFLNRMGERIICKVKVSQMPSPDVLEDLWRNGVS